MNKDFWTGVKVWVCVKVLECEHCSMPDGGSRSMEFMGVFSCKDLAIDACRDYNYFIFPVGLNEVCPETPTLIENGYYPIIN